MEKTTWNTGILESWNNGIDHMEYWSIGIME